jgi:hypothetical protein
MVGGLIGFGSTGARAADLDKTGTAAVVVYLAGSAPPFVARVVQTRVEQLLTDNGVTVLDKDAVEKLKADWEKLKDPGALVTAEEFVEKSKKYRFDTVYRAYVTAGFARGLGEYFTATAAVDLRILGAEGKTTSVASGAMGTRGNPPSDGLTAEAALTNAVQRAADFTVQKRGLMVPDPTAPRTVPLSLVLDPNPVDSKSIQAPVDVPNDVKDKLVKSSKLLDGKWHNETATCVALSPEKSLGAVATYEKLTRPQQSERFYGSKVHLIEFDAGREISTLEMAKVGPRPRSELGISEPLGCGFIGSWRYLVAATGNRIFLWDTERGIELSQTNVPEPLESGQLVVAKAPDDSVRILLTSGRKAWSYRVSVNPAPR